MIGVCECDQHIRIVVTRCDESGIGMSEHLPETSPGSDRRDGWSEVDHTVCGEQINYIVVVPVIDVVRIAMD